MIREEILKTSLKEIPKAIHLLLTATKEIKEEIKFSFCQGIHSYISTKYNSFSHIKTILHRQAPRFFYDIYQPQAITCNAERIAVNDYKTLSKYGPYVTIIGGPGSGKTTLLRHLFMSSLCSMERIPLYIELRRIDFNNQSIVEIIYKIIQNDFNIESDRLIKRLLEEQKFIILLDGFDELPFGLREKFIIKLNELIEKYPNNIIHLTSRPSPVAELIQGFSNVRIENFTLEEALLFLEKQDLNDELLENLQREIKDRKWNEAQNFLSNPLLLSTYVLTYKNNSTVPEKNSEFYERVINALFSEHDSWHKNGYVRKAHSDLSIDVLKHILYEFSFRNTFHTKYAFDIVSLNSDFESVLANLKVVTQIEKLKEDFTVSYGILLEDAGVYQFIHRSLQDYLAAQKVKRINSDNKKLIYDKIYSIAKKSAGFEIGNFIEFVSEIDEYYFNKFFLVRLLSEFFSQYDEKFPIASTIACFFSKIYFEDESSTQYSLNIAENPLRSIKEFRKIENYFLGQLIHHKPFMKMIRSKAKLNGIGLRMKYVYLLNKKSLPYLEDAIQQTAPKFASLLETEINNLRTLKSTVEIKLKESLEEERKLLEKL
ncbi:NACHT domain-containing protein [Leptospira saintgironsiae]|uniref:NACHT domain-containing protein n=1 Tax=Leptospira saintgironsiae TaxID=2023183 RepID=A0A2M9Y8T7_9LEPT|nr:NACHT domain-containing protein [Leptospira saintgironsiae]PJZ47942.1 hypothetical protein CH362_16755 [Leptospira saintgironsiae]